MNGVAGDLDVGFMAVSGKALLQRLVNLASALSVPLKQTPDAPTLADLGVANQWVFAFIGPKGMPAEARDAIAVAIGDVISTEGTKVNGLLNRHLAVTIMQAVIFWRWLRAILQLQAS